MATDTPVKDAAFPSRSSRTPRRERRSSRRSHSRSYNYFTPRKRRATVYEDVTVDVQPDPARHLTQGWVYAFANGDAGYPEKWTVLKCSNWHEFLDPNEEWEQTIYRNGAAIVRQIPQNIEHGRHGRVLPVHLPGSRSLEKHVFAWAHLEHIGMHVYTPAQRDAPTNMINNAMAVGAAHKLRFAQDLILYNLDARRRDRRFDGSIHKQTWQDDPTWQPTRKLAEELTGIRDWSEPRFATAVVFEPLIGELFRSGFVMQVAAPHGDFVTPTIMGAGESDAAREQRGRAPSSGCSPTTRRRRGNKEVMQGWLEECVGGGRERGAHAAADLVPAVREGRALPGLLRALPPRFETLLDDIGLETPKEVRHDEFVSDRTSSNMAGVTLMNNQVGYVVAGVMRDKEGVTVTELPSMIRVDGAGKVDFDYEEIAEALGWDDFGNDDFEEIMSTHYGRMVVLDDRMLLFANPEDAAEYIGFDLQPVQ